MFVKQKSGLDATHACFLVQNAPVFFLPLSTGLHITYISADKTLCAEAFLVLRSPLSPVYSQTGETACSSLHGRTTGSAESQHMPHT